jgi:CRP/FNR family transcriptional regulator, anaerobic regulatory protein
MNKNEYSSAASPSERTSRQAETLWRQDQLDPRFCERIASGRAITWEGDPCEYLFVVVEGTVRHCRLLLDGQRIIAGFGYPGDLIGFSFRDRYLFTTEAVTDCRVRRISATRANASSLDVDLSEELTREHCRMHARALSMLHKSADQRVADFMLDTGRQIASPLRNGSMYLLTMSRADIADHLGLTVETVCRGISRLRRDGVLEIEHSNLVIIRNLSELQERASQDQDADLPLDMLGNYSRSQWATRPS